MYKIKVIAPITSWNIERGYFTSCYRSRGEDGEQSTWIAFTDRPEEEHLHKVFKTRKQAENKIKFLEEKTLMNGYMSDWKFEAEEIPELNT